MIKKTVEKNLTNEVDKQNSSQNSSQNQEQSLDQIKNKKNHFGLLKILILFSLLGIGSLIWILQTQTGGQFFLHSLSIASGGQLHVEGVKGNLSHRMHIDELRLTSAQSNIIAKNIQLDWQLFSLLSKELTINSLEISSISVTSAPSNTKIVIPKNLQLPISIQIKKMLVGRIFINTYGPNKNVVPQLYLSGLEASYTGNTVQHLLKGVTHSDWGTIKLEADIANQAPFNIKGNFTYLTENSAWTKIQKNNSIPDVSVHGEITGSLSDIKIDALASPVESSLPSDKSLQGELSLYLKPFERQILQGVKIHLNNLNPMAIHKNAPNAQLNIDIDVDNKGKNQLIMSGNIDVHNAKPMSLDKNGLPFSLISSMIIVSDKHVELKNTKVNMGSGSVKGDLAIQWQGVELEKINSTLTFANINLLNIDSRLHKTSIQGHVQASNKTHHQINIQAKLNDGKTNLNASSHLLFNTDNHLSKFKLDEFNLTSLNKLNLFSLVGKGELSFEEREAFQFLGEVNQFDPSQWMDAPKAKLAGKIEIKGQILPTVQLQLSIPSIKGNVENQIILGNSELFWQQNKSLNIKSFNFQLADNKISAQGKLGAESDTLMVKVDAPNLTALAPIIKQKISGNVQFEAAIKGSLFAPSGTLNINANNLQIRENTHIGKLDGVFKFSSKQQSPIQIDLNIFDVKNKVSNSNKSESLGELNNTYGNKNKNAKKDESFVADSIHIKVNGKNNDHTIDGSIAFNPSKILEFKASGGIDLNSSELNWKGQLNNFMMSKLFQLKNPMSMVLSQKKIQLGSGKFDGEIGNINLDSFVWSPGNTQTKGNVQKLKLFQIIDLIKPQKTLNGDIQLNADWQLQFQDTVKGNMNITRESGDILIDDVDLGGQRVALGLEKLDVHVRFGGLIAGSDAEKVYANIEASGTRLGQWKSELESQLRYVAGQWQLSSESPLKGNLQAKIPDLQWIGRQVHSEFALKGKLDVDAKIDGNLGHPRYLARLEGRQLELAFDSEGLLLTNGTLSAIVSDEFVKLTQLKFSNAITLIPRHEKLQDLTWLGQVGDLVASGEVDLKKQSGEILVEWNRFPLLQRKDRWLVTTGQAKITQLNKTWSLLGKMKADGAYFQLPKLPPPSLSNDVVVTRGVKSSVGAASVENEADKASSGIKTKLDMTLDMGSNFVFVGRGLDTPLTGSLRLRSFEGSPIVASGSILARGGKYEGYGQQLEIERGILNFQGSPSNPSLNIRALRKGLPVEAGVDVTGSVSNPIVRLVSEPNVPDSEKLSWLVLGRESDQVSTNDASLLFSAAGAIFGGDGSRNIPKEFVQKLGFDEFSIGPAESAGSSKLPSQTVAGATAVGSSSNDQVVKISARIKPGIVFSVEKGISDASGALKLSWLLSRRVKLVGRYGTDSSVDAKYTFSFN